MTDIQVLDKAVAEQKEDIVNSIKERVAKLTTMKEAISDMRNAHFNLGNETERYLDMLEAHGLHMADILELSSLLSSGRYHEFLETLEEKIR